jgi:fimbrial chaperone protein
VGGFAWSEDEAGTFRLAATSNVVVFPQLVTIPPLGVQRVRAAFVAAASSNEQAFRIVIEDIPSLDETIHAAPGANISIRTRFTLPVYVEPVTRVRSARIQGAEVRNGKLSFSLINSGNTHLSGSSLNVDGRDGAGKTVFASKIEEWHVLAGASRIYTVEISKSECAAMRKLTISAGDSRMLTAQTVDVASCT